MTKIYFVAILIFLQLTTGCKKFLTVKAPQDQLVSQIVFSDDSTATAALIGVYQTLCSHKEYFTSGNKSITLLTGLSADELDNYSGNFNLEEFYHNNISPINNINSGIWDQLYEGIYQCNSVLEGLTGSLSIATNLKQQLSGEALFLRAFFYFYLVNLYGPVPMALTTNYQVNDTLHRSSVETIYDQIINDLLRARQILEDEYASGAERIRANRSAVNALLARIYLYRHYWRRSVACASLVINRSDKYKLCPQIEDVFLKNSSEAILQLQPTLPLYNTFDADVFILNSYPTSVTCSKQLIKGFESFDRRMSGWIGRFTTGHDTFYFPYKYKVQAPNVVREYLMLFRLGELYLVRGEAYAQLGMPDSATADLNMIRIRAGLQPMQLASKEDALQAINKERQLELFAEWGHRWLDLKRTGMIDQTLGIHKSPWWKSSATLYPIPQSDIILNPHLTQNAGY
ncbi:RagB/SusD family nutrient uptake outer membrane protein [Chitinophaga filiformis]|uniref:RagB/SusD family nutrient uptake outer membrane protein n=1 Tax=Chitinophaga filiformis TaxID=104663 RepID=A0ABY4HW92_CHIFI|nr:RagB/SusD family nutrient uptake outer membrane protein [Chitinophaga filiformis]UPK68062.1 RagB/SusD family nutrient uptake outer membrane protein [Chitinophaga filiformis]